MKELFIYVLITVAAIGGMVTSVNAQYLAGSNVKIPCDVSGPSCAIALGL